MKPAKSIKNLQQSNGMMQQIYLDENIKCH
jgi:hypothetical protein